MAARKQSDPSKLAISPDPADQQDGGHAPGDATVIIPDEAEAPPAAPPAVNPDVAAVVASTISAPLNTTPGSFFPPSDIPVHVGTAGYYTGARPYEDLASYNARLDTVADTFGDLGWILGTKPRV